MRELARSGILRVVCGCGWSVCFAATPLSREKLMSTTAVEQDRKAQLGTIYAALQKLRDGDFSARLPEEWDNYSGMVARVFNSLAAMMEELSGEFIRITEEVGKRGEYGGQAEVYGIYGRWREMYDSLNRMGVGLTVEVRRTSQAAQAWAEGDASKRLAPEFIAGEFAEMQQRLNGAVERWGRT